MLTAHGELHDFIIGTYGWAVLCSVLNGYQRQSAGGDDAQAAPQPLSPVRESSTHTILQVSKVAR